MVRGLDDQRYVFLDVIRFFESRSNPTKDPLVLWLNGVFYMLGISTIMEHLPPFL